MAKDINEFIEMDKKEKAEAAAKAAAEEVAEAVEVTVERPETEVDNSWYTQMSASLPTALIKQREGWRGKDGKTVMVDYIEWSTVVYILDRLLGHNWNYETTLPTVVGDQAVCKARITIPWRDNFGNEMLLVREGIGTGPAKTEMGIKKAEHDALKRAAVKLGIGLELYSKEENEEVYSERKATFADTHPEAEARQSSGRGQYRGSSSKQISDKQINFVRKLAKDNDVNIEELCDKKYGSSLSGITSKDASELIDWLQQKEAF